MFTKQCLKYIITPFLIPILISGIILQGVLATISHAASNITSDGTMGTTVTQAESIYNINGGTIRGNNQFHSFGLFSVGTGDTASFNGPNYITNIIGRVTGGQPSVINGILSSTIIDANLYLLNPYGVLFGKDASLNVSGSFHVSTADYLKLSDGGIFYSNPISSSVLTIAAPAAFGFLSNNPAPIMVQESTLQVPKGKALSLVGGDINITNNTSGYLWAPSGQINLISVASPGEVNINDFNTNSFTKLGNITTSQLGSSLGISVEGSDYNVDPAGAIVIRGGKLLFINNTWFGARGNPGGTVNIVGDDLHMDNSNISTATRGNVDHPGTGVDMNVIGNILLTNGSEIASSGYGAGRAGDIKINAGDIQLGDNDPTQSLYASFGFYGDIGSRAFGSGRGGDVYITADNLTVKNGFFINTAALSWGNAGNVTVHAGTLELLDRGSISSNALWVGQGGVVDVIANDIIISGENAPNVPNSTGLTGLAAQTGYWSKGGLLKINADNLQLLDGGQISTLLYSIGPGANIEINAKNILISGNYIDQGIRINSSIDALLSGPYATGTGGNINVVSDSLKITDGGYIGTFLYGNAPGNAGNILIQTQGLEISSEEISAGISASSVSGTGNAGNIEIKAKDIIIVGQMGALEPFGKNYVGISASTKSGKGGSIWITAENLILTDRAYIGSGSYGAGRAGDIEMDTENLEVLNGSIISNGVFGSGDGGRIDIKANRILLSGVCPEPYFESAIGIETLAPSAIASQTVLGGGNAGDVQITADSLQVMDGARISVETFGAGHGGSIEISADNILVSGINTILRDYLVAYGGDPKGAGAAIVSVSHRSSLGDDVGGNAGDIQVTTGNLQMEKGGLISSATNTPGAGGTIEIIANRVSLSTDAFISARSNSSNDSNAGQAGDILITALDTFQSNHSTLITAAEQARGGDITLQATQVQLINGTLISAESSGLGDAGNINIISTNSLMMRNSSITTEAKQADGGNINIQSGYMDQLIDSKITASVGGGSDTIGGNIIIDPQYILLNDSQIIANAYEGMGGNIRIIADVFLASPDSMVDASSALGIDGTVDIQAPISNISGTLAPMQGSFLLSEALLRDRCMAKILGEKVSSFIISGRDGLPIRPGSVLPSPIY